MKSISINRFTKTLVLGASLVSVLSYQISFANTVSLGICNYAEQSLHITSVPLAGIKITQMNNTANAGSSSNCKTTQVLQYDLQGTTNGKMSFQAVNNKDPNASCLYNVSINNGQISAYVENASKVICTPKTVESSKVVFTFDQPS